MRNLVLPVNHGGPALCLLLLAVAASAAESFFVQTYSIHHALTWESVRSTINAPLLCIDVLSPLALALLSRRAFALFLVGQTAISAVVLHYGSFFYNTLTLSTIYHSMQGLSYLGGSAFVFVKPGLLLLLAFVLAVKLLLVRLSAAPVMPHLWNLRGVAAVICLMLVSVTVFWEHGRSGILSLWTGEGPHRTAVDRRSQEGAKESVRSLGYLATWAGEWMGGVYRDTSLIYAEKRCPDPNVRFLEQHPESVDAWCGCPLPPPFDRAALIQVESLDYAAPFLIVNGERVMPFLHSLLSSSLLLRAFAPHKVGSANSDYELLNGRVADQNVMYYSYIREYPDSVIREAAAMRPAVFHGLEGNLFNLREAYRLMGFDRTFFKEELTDEGYPTSRLAMEQVADEHVLDAAARYLEEGEGRAVFVVTMSSHIPFMEPRPLFGPGRGMFFRYISSLRYVDECLADFYARLPEGALLALWGDHGSDVSYPSDMTPNGRRVPFLLHVKGNDAWIADRENDVPQQEFTLCSLSWLLRAVLRRAYP